jgi:hypothetical protein
VTTWEPGARLVFTQGLFVRPRAAAFFANRPAAIKTDGFEVLVQLVIAAITTSPCVSCSALWPILTLVASLPGAPLVPAMYASASGAGSSLPIIPTSDLRKLRFDCVSTTRSCGRAGPASEGTTVARSSESVSVKRGVGESFVRNSPWALA